jgi:hypothetical protein
VNRKAKGTRNQHRSMRLEAAGSSCTRGAASLEVSDVLAIAPNDHLPVQGDHPMAKWNRNERYPQLLVSVVLPQVDLPLEGSRKGTAHEGVLNGRQTFR